MELLKIQESFKIDCSKCCGLCCVSLYFSKIDGFCENKPAKKPCKNLESNFKCKIHSSLKRENLTGCLSFDCLGAGQWITQKFETDFNRNPLIMDEFIKVMHLQYTLYYLAEVVRISHDPKAFDLFNKGIAVRESLTNYDSYINEANAYLKNYVKTYYSTKKDYSMRSLIKKDFKGQPCSNICFLGADLRDANVCDVDLSSAHFLTQSQINSCIGNKNTKLPNTLIMPSHWLEGKNYE